VSVATFHGKRLAENAAAVPALWVDLDPAKEATAAELAAWREAAALKLSTFTPAPSVVVFSGRGFHGYWCLAEPVRLEGPERSRLAARVVSCNKALEDRLKGDTVGDLARVMRLPGTVNPKPNGGPCRIVFSDGPRYRLEDLAELLAVFPTEKTADPPASGETLMEPPRTRREENPMKAPAFPVKRGRGRPRVGVTERDLRTLPPWARELVRGGAWAGAQRGRYRKPDGTPDRSAADLAAVLLLVRAGWDDEKIVAAFRHPRWKIGARFAELWHRESPQRAESYLARTIQKARVQESGRLGA
jgi:hypothetical protein